MKYEILYGITKTKNTINPKQHHYEHGAHFKYVDLYSKLILLYCELPLERLGNNHGVYFQETEPKTKHYSDIQTNLTFNSCINRLKTCNIFRQYTQSATSKNTTNTSSMLRKYKSKVCLGQTISNINVKNERKNKSSIKRKHLIKLNKKMKLNLGMIGTNNENKKAFTERGECNVKKKEFPLINRNNGMKGKSKESSIEMKVSQFQHFNNLYKKSKVVTPHMRIRCIGMRYNTEG